MPCVLLGTVGAVLTLWASMAQAIGSAGRPACSRTVRRRWTPSFSIVPSAVQELKQEKTVGCGGKSRGR
jgi:hypothetical protein